MTKFDFSQLNEEQLKPVMDTEGAVLVTAGAGSGKTRLLTHRIAHLISDLGVSPYNILAITFTNKAANEMKTRLYDMLPRAGGLWVSTFHSMCVSILRKFIDNIGFSSNFSIYSEYEKESLIKKLVRGLDDQDLADDIYKKISHYISEAKNDGLMPDQFESYYKHLDDARLIGDIYTKYSAELIRSNSLDFDDLLLKAYELLAGSAEAREHYQERFRYIHVDEFQDTNTIQYKLVSILAAKHRNIFIVGDEDQSIYGWRGANIDNIRKFISDFGAKTYKLEQNYRSSKNIIDLANKLISNNTSRIEKTLWTDNPGGVRIEYYTAQRDSDEADYVVSCINGLKNHGYKYSDFAILMRINALTRSFEQRMLQYNIPYKVFGGFKFFERKEIKDILAYLRIAVNPLDNEAIQRVINFPKRGIGDGTVGQLANYSLVSGQSLYNVILGIDSNPDLPNNVVKKVSAFSEVLRKMEEEKGHKGIVEYISFVVELIGLKELYAEDTEENENRKMHIMELINTALEYERQNEDATLEDFLQMVTLYTDLDEMDEANNCVSVATVHSAKGLEFKAVFVVGLEDGIFPIGRARDSLAEMEEERRLLYVAITRAKERLFLTRTRSRFLYGKTTESIASRFLKELDLERPARDRSDDGRSERAGDSQRQGSKDDYSAYYRANRQPESAGGSKSGKFRIGMMVRHKRFGEGKILNISEMGIINAEIDFEKIGKMTLALDFAPLEVVDNE